jgi:hypothetical protein
MCQLRSEKRCPCRLHGGLTAHTEHKEKNLETGEWTPVKGQERTLSA